MLHMMNIKYVIHMHVLVRIIAVTIEVPSSCTRTDEVEVVDLVQKEWTLL